MATSAAQNGSGGSLAANHVGQRQSHMLAAVVRSPGTERYKIVQYRHATVRTSEYV